jgi:hypothetical protein
MADSQSDDFVECYVCARKEPREPYPIGWEAVPDPLQFYRKTHLCPKHRRGESKALATLGEIAKR